MWHKPGLLKAVADLLFLLGGAALLFAAIVWGAVRRDRLGGAASDPVSARRNRRGARVAGGSAQRSRAVARRGDARQLLYRQCRRLAPGARRVGVGAPRRGLAQVAGTRRSADRGTSGRSALGQSAGATGEYLRRGVCRRTVACAESASAERAAWRVGGTSAPARRVRRDPAADRILQPIGRQPAEVLLSPRLAWLLKLEDGLLVELGREQAKAPIRVRLQRFVDYYATITNSGQARPVAVDMRYPNGFAICVIRMVSHCALLPVPVRMSKERNEQG